MGDFCVAIRLIAIAFILVSCASHVHGQDYGQAADTVRQSLNTDDGPHVYWQDDTMAVVFYYCDEHVESQTYVSHDTVRFQGFCGDSQQIYAIPVGAPTIAPAEFENVSRVFAVSDVHGDYTTFTEILVNAGVVDSSLRWTWGDGHLVIDGDVFDRGDGVTECLWLIYRLEHEAAAAGGAVHFLLGNHEVMVLQGDLRYVHDRYMDGIGRRFNYEDLFGWDMELGRWLRSKPAAIRINRTLFVHGGISPDYAADYMDINYLNDLTRRGVALSPLGSYLEDSTKGLFGSLGPFWYRGYHYALENRYPEIAPEELRDMLNHFDVDRVVVGHTQYDSVSSVHGGQVIAIDVVVEDLGGQQGLLLENGQPYRVYPDGSRTSLE